MIFLIWLVVFTVNFYSIVFDEDLKEHLRLFYLNLYVSYMIIVLCLLAIFKASTI